MSSVLSHSMHRWLEAGVYFEKSKRASEAREQSQDGEARAQQPGGLEPTGHVCYLRVNRSQGRVLKGCGFMT